MCRISSHFASDVSPEDLCVRKCSSIEQEHVVEVACETLFSLFQIDAKLADCQVQVTRKLECGHNALVACHAQLGKEPPCEVVVKDRFVYPCGLQFQRLHQISARKM